MQWIEEGIKLPEEYRTEDPLTTVAYTISLYHSSPRVQESLIPRKPLTSSLSIVPGDQHLGTADGDNTSRVYRIQSFGIHLIDLKLRSSFRKL